VDSIIYVGYYYLHHFVLGGIAPLCDAIDGNLHKSFFFPCPLLRAMPSPLDSVYTPILILFAPCLTQLLSIYTTALHAIFTHSPHSHLRSPLPIHSITPPRHPFTSHLAPLLPTYPLPKPPSAMNATVKNMILLALAMGSLTIASLDFGPDSLAFKIVKQSLTLILGTVSVLLVIFFCFSSYN
jgi:hypothetical protein